MPSTSVLIWGGADRRRGASGLWRPQRLSSNTKVMSRIACVGMFALARRCICRTSWNGATAQWNSPLACLRVRERPRNDRATTSSPKGDPAGDEVRVLLRRERPSWEVASFYGTHSRKAEKARLIQGGPATLGRYSSCWPPRKIESTVIAILRAGHPVELDAGPAK
jgi:hypothetical protein